MNCDTKVMLINTEFYLKNILIAMGFNNWVLSSEVSFKTKQISNSIGP